MFDLCGADLGQLVGAENRSQMQVHVHPDGVEILHIAALAVEPVTRPGFKARDRPVLQGLPVVGAPL